MNARDRTTDRVCKLIPAAGCTESNKQTLASEPCILLPLFGLGGTREAITISRGKGASDSLLSVTHVFGPLAEF